MPQTKRDILQKYLNQPMQVAKRIVDNASKAYANSLQSVNDRKRQVLNDLVKNVVPVASAKVAPPYSVGQKPYTVPKAGGGYTTKIKSTEGGEFTLQSVIKGNPQYTWTPPEGYEKIANPKSIAAYDKVITNPLGDDMWGVPKANASEIMESLKFKPPASYYSKIPNVEAIKNYSKTVKDPETGEIYGVPLPSTEIPTISWEEAHARGMQPYVGWSNEWVRENFFKDISYTVDPETGQKIKVGIIPSTAPGYGGSLRGQSIGIDGVSVTDPTIDQRQKYWNKMLRGIEEYKIAHGQPLPSEESRAGAWGPFTKPPTY